MSSIVVILSKMFTLYPHGVDVMNMLLNTLKYIFQQQLHQPTVSYFPSYSLESEEGSRASRLGWCYGDLGIAQAILQAAKTLRSIDYENEALKILLYNCNRRDLKENHVLDAGLCHGASGISHIFNRLYVNTKMEEFKEASVYWMEKTVEMAQFGDGLAGFKTWQGGKKEWENQYSLLEGITGIGLSILSLLNPDLMQWDECLLLS